jgi:enoyl-CoA hydratase/carnithine racemase
MRIAILTGAGDKAFCAGGDLKEMVEKRACRCRRAICSRVPYDNIELSKPTIAAVNGVAFAGGWMICAGHCDLCVASTNAKFAITEVKVGRGSPVGGAADPHDPAAHHDGDHPDRQTDHARSAPTRSAWSTGWPNPEQT